MKHARWKAGALAGLVLGVWLSACGETDANKPGTSGSEGSGGSGGSSGGSGGEAGAGSEGPLSAMCGTTLCEGLSLGVPGGPETDACCPENSPDEPCGVKTDFLEAFDVQLSNTCQRLHSPGVLDENCPESPPLMISSLSLNFPGCCLPSGKCGFMLDSVFGGAIPLNLGCLDASELPNPDVSDPPDCGTGQGSGGEGGEGGAG